MQRCATGTVLARAAGTAAAGTLQLFVTGQDNKPAADTVVLVQPAAATAVPTSADTAVIVQKDSRFVPYVTVVPVGATVRFVNRDAYDHHIRSQPGGPLGSVAPAKQFEFRLARARGSTEASADLKADIAGNVLLGCHIHNAMRGHLVIAQTPWFAVTDDNGRATIAGVPDGSVDLRVMHPDQLVDQAPLKVLVAATPAPPVEMRLNFTPRKRPPPVVPKKGEYDF